MFLFNEFKKIIIPALNILLILGFIYCARHNYSNIHLSHHNIITMVPTCSVYLR